MDLLDLTFRIERSFGVKIAPGDYDRLPGRVPFEATAGEIHELVVRICIERGVEVPWSSWNKVRKALAEVTGKSPKLIHRDTWIVRDLDFST
jgi:hypothetical protein